MIPLDLVLHNAQVVDVFRLRLFTGWVGIKDGRFIYVETETPPDDMQVAKQVDLNGAILAPGLFDSHMHIESSLITPRRFAEAVVPFGTTTILSDPHEVGNVAGEDGIRWMIRASKNLPLRIYHSIPSCVPATAPELEWTAQVMQPEIVTRLAEEESVIALGEVMDYQGLLGDNPRLLSIVQAAHAAGLIVEGHIPTLQGVELSQYLSNQVSSDHTLTTPEKIREQVSKGLAVMLQTKSLTPENMAAVAELPEHAPIILVTDDLEPPLLAVGHLSRMVELAIEAGMPPLEALAAASIRPARYLNRRDLGAIAPGYWADCIVMREVVSFPPEQVYAAGQLVAENGVLLPIELPALPTENAAYPVPGPLQVEDFRLVKTDDLITSITANVVAIQNKRTTLTKLERLSVAVQDGFAVFEAGDQLALAAIFARDGSSSVVGVIKNTGLTDGAFASTVQHDCHNLLVIGRDVAAMQAAAQKVYAMGGGIAVAQGDTIQASLSLPYFGLLSDAPVPEVAQDLTAVETALRSLGMDHQRPFLLLSIMGLSVSPYVKFTDKGIVDTEKRRLLPVWDYAN